GPRRSRGSHGRCPRRGRRGPAGRRTGARRVAAGTAARPPSGGEGLRHGRRRRQSAAGRPGRPWPVPDRAAGTAGKPEPEPEPLSGAVRRGAGERLAPRRAAAALLPRGRGAGRRLPGDAVGRRLAPRSGRPAARRRQLGRLGPAGLGRRPRCGRWRGRRPLDHGDGPDRRRGAGLAGRLDPDGPGPAVPAAPAGRGAV
ncbi:MAG: hypothetical protein AVDCRST_MAG59-1426, partial [uncultured Thermomicrobiales bacterium]